jgi:hypothetical protein
MALLRWVWWQQCHGSSTHLKMKWCFLHESLNFILPMSLPIHGVELLYHLFFGKWIWPSSLCDIHKELSKDFLFLIFVSKLDPKTMSCLSLIRTHYSGNIIHDIPKKLYVAKWVFSRWMWAYMHTSFPYATSCEDNYISSNILFTIFFHLHIYKMILQFCQTHFDYQPIMLYFNPKLFLPKISLVFF